jgi:membrane protein implicated in regulation of membrane protease activity
MGNLVEWWNLPFTLPFALAVLYLLLTITGIAGTGDGHDADGASDATGDASADGAGEADAGEMGDAGDGGDGEGGAVGHVLELLGLGRVPLAIAIQLFLFVWGFAGWAATSVLAPALREPLVFFWPALLIAAAAAFGATVLLARPLARLLPSSESHGVAKRELTGRIGTVVLPVSDSGGLAHVRDSRGNVHQIACHTRTPGDGGASIHADTPAASAVIPKGAEVIVVTYDGETGRYLVVESDLPRLRR